MNDLLVANVDKNVLKKLISANHYSGTCSSISVGYGVRYKGKLSGGIVFSAGVGRHANAYCRICKPTEVIELTRLWLSDELPKNSESRVVGLALRVLRKGRGRFRAVLSYADEFAGHVGTIYQATNFRYMGCTTSNATKIRIGNLIVNSRSLNSRYGTSQMDRLKKILGTDDIERVGGQTRKHAYVYPLDDVVAAWLEQNKKPYPKRASVV
ncbi:Mom family adenine methylcarbamoylation protein [Alicyclobacillus fastidiosus]|uniref:Uncharacterized protein n=1 Tax=Alicyclobacillus fastidiosus TaxID=392011 RepID=A0ABV5ALA3_9BACL|nr:hypothetical protein [Alicyclobacillus fastidiosus]WEH08493.1 hypothetical protein PYS47_17625 [Alicyclobacillus fastidiosus]